MDRRVTDAAISVQQPWAWAIGLGIKDVENRTWALPAKFRRAPLWLHAGKKLDHAGVYALMERFGLHAPGALPRGCVVGAVELGEPVLGHNSPWFAGPVGWLVLRAALLPVPVPARGQLGFWIPNEMRGRSAADFLDKHGVIPTGGTHR